MFLALRSWCVIRNLILIRFHYLKKKEKEFDKFLQIKWFNPMKRVIQVPNFSLRSDFAESKTKTKESTNSSMMETISLTGGLSVIFFLSAHHWCRRRMWKINVIITGVSRTWWFDSGPFRSESVWEGSGKSENFVSSHRHKWGTRIMQVLIIYMKYKWRIRSQQTAASYLCPPTASQPLLSPPLLASTSCYL